MKQRLIACVAIIGCADTGDVDDVSTIESSLVQVSIPAVSPDGAPMFEKVHHRNTDDPSAQLNFEMVLENTGTQPVALSKVAISYELDRAPFGESPTVGAADLRTFYLQECSRSGFGPSRTGAFTLNLPAVESEGFSDVHQPSSNVYATVRAKSTVTLPSDNSKVEVSRFTAAKLDDGRTLAWARLVNWFGFEDRATALTPTDADVTSYIAVGGAHANGAPWRFAAVKLMPDGSIGTKADGSLWQTTIPFAGCDAEALDVERLTVAGADNLYFLAGDANCAGDHRIALAMLDSQGGLVWQTTYDPGPQPAHVGGVAVDPSNNQLYVVGRYGEDMLVINTDSAGALDPAYASGGIRIINPGAYDKVFGRDAKVLSDGTLVIAAEGQQLSSGHYQLGLWRLTEGGILDPLLNSTGVKWISFDGYPDARGADLEVHESETWFTVSGVGYTATKSRMVAAAFATNGDLRTSFGRLGKLVIEAISTPLVTRSFLRGDFITLVGGTGTILAGARFHRKDGTLDDPAILSPGDRCALLWPDTGTLPQGATHAFNEWIWNLVPQEVHADFTWTPLPSGAPVVAPWGASLQLFTDQMYTDGNGDIVEKNWPLERGDIPGDEFWKVTQGHEIDTNHRGVIAYSTAEDRYVANQRYAYDISMRRWTGSDWTSLIIDPDGNGPIVIDDSQNWHRLAYGRPVHPIADGEIIGCSWGVQENAAPGVKDAATTCNASGIPCYYADVGGNYVRVRHADGTISKYSHMQNTNPALCPNVGSNGPVNPPIAVTRDTVLGLVGNSGNSTGPHLHVLQLAPFPAGVDPLDPTVDLDLYMDSIPLMFHDVWGADPDVAPDDWGAIPTPMPAMAFLSNTMIRHLEGGGAPPPETTCEEVQPLGGQNIVEANLSDGDAPHGNGLGLYCEDILEDDDTITIRVCVENGVNGSSDCETCGGETAFPGCPCEGDGDCGDMTCWANDVGGGPGNGLFYGRCYPTVGQPPQWICPYDCEAQLGEGAWCFNKHPSNQAKCIAPNTFAPEVVGCWEDNGLDPLVPNPDAGDACVVECSEVVSCADRGYPAIYTCAPNNTCMRPL